MDRKLSTKPESRRQSTREGRPVPPAGSPSHVDTMVGERRFSLTEERSRQLPTVIMSVMLVGSAWLMLLSRRLLRLFVVMIVQRSHKFHGDGVAGV